MEGFFVDRPFAIILAVDRTGLYTQRKPAIKTRPFIALAVLVTSLIASAEGVAAEPTLDLLPYPQEVAVGSGSITVPSLDSIQVRLAPKNALPVSGYTIKVGPKNVEITAADKAGAFYAKKTLEQLAQKKGDRYTIPRCTIRDWPAFAWRGVMLDECRHFFGKEAVKKTLDAMADHKMNVFHWHLTEDQAWRLAVPKFPKLITYGAVRSQSQYPDGLGKGRELDGQKYGPFYYTEADVREIVAYAKARQIRVIPEIELPGHAYAAIVSYPNLCCSGKVGARDPWARWGISREIFCAGNDETIKFLEQVLEYVVSLFPDEVVHIGGDEAPKSRWAACPKCQARIKEKGLKDENELQAWMTRHFVEFLAKKGRRAVGWDEVMAAEIPASTMIMWWHGKNHDVVTDAVTKGHDVIACPSGSCYFDFLQCEPEEYEKRGYGYPTRRAKPLTVKAVWGFNPYGGVSPEQQKKIVGIQCNLWSEHILTPTEMEWKLWPRAAAIAETGWRGPNAGTWADFRRRCLVDIDRMTKAGHEVYHFPGFHELRLMSYNVHTMRSGKVDEAKELGRLTGLCATFAEAIPLQE